MHPRTFRFAVVTALAPTASAWQETAQRAEELGYSTLLVPDTMTTLDPFSALASAAAATDTLRVGTFVLPAPFYPPSEIAWRALSLDLLSGGRFDLGLGAGRPAAETEVVHRERAFGSPAERVKQLSDVIHIAKEEIAAATEGRSPLKPVQRPHPPILVAAAGRKMFQLAAAEADIITLGLDPRTTEEGLAAKVAELRAIAGSRFDDLEINYNLSGIGTNLPDFLRHQMGVDTDELLRTGAPAILTGTPREMAEKLRRRRDELGISYIAVNGMFLEELAPVVEMLAGT